MTRSVSAVVVAMLLAVSTARPAWAEGPEATSGPAPTPSVRKAGWFSLGAGGALMAGSAVFFVMAARSHAKLAESHERHVTDAFVREFMAAKILGTVGVLAAGTGITLVLVSAPHHEVRVTAGLGQLGFSGRF
jgi:hypothetical protein